MQFIMTETHPPRATAQPQPKMNRGLPGLPKLKSKDASSRAQSEFANVLESKLQCWRGCLPLEGVHSYKPHIVAYRNDFCVSCAAPRRAFQVRSFKAYQFYYIPIVPLGFWREWQCSACGRDPHMYPGTSGPAWWVVVMPAGL